jgi:epoxyqueuosine reductase QueG
LFRLLADGGAALVGVADLAPLPPGEREGFPRAVSVAVRLDPAALATVKEHPTAAYDAEYVRANALLAELVAAAAGLLEGEGHGAAPLRPTTEGYDRTTLRDFFPHKTGATLAGLGWIGKSALLVTPRLGPGVRLATVLTNAPLPAGSPVTASRCGTCRRCVTACPAGALTNTLWSSGTPREELVDPFACQRQCREFMATHRLSHTICGICVAACPFGRGG